jgi:hypothetical protein
MPTKPPRPPQSTGQRIVAILAGVVAFTVAYYLMYHLTSGMFSR